jgi:hypothetical protein
MNSAAEFVARLRKVDCCAVSMRLTVSTSKAWSSEFRCSFVAVRLAMSVACHWRKVCLALTILFASLLLISAQVSPTAAEPIQQVSGKCSVPGWSLPINFGPLAGYCGEDSGNTQTGCPARYSPQSVGGSTVCNVAVFNPVSNPAVRNAVSKALSGATFSRLSAELKAQGNPYMDPDVAEEAVREQLDFLHSLGLNDEAINQLYDPASQLPVGPQPVPLAPALRLGMSVGPDPFESAALGMAEGAAVLNSRSLGALDTAGLLGGGITPGAKDVSGGGRISAIYDATRFLPTNHSLFASTSFQYARDNITLGADPTVGVGSAGAAQTDNYLFSGSFRYRVNSTYLTGAVRYNSGHGSEALSIDGSTGSFSFHGFSTDWGLGNTFVLVNTMRFSSNHLRTKDPPKLIGGYILALDVSAHVGTANQITNSFTDSSGFTFGTDTTRAGAQFDVVPAMVGPPNKPTTHESQKI